LQRLDEWTLRLRALAAGATGEVPVEGVDAFELALDDDLNISAALGAVFEMIRQTNRGMDAATLTPNEAAYLLRWLGGVNSVLVFDPDAEPVPDQVHQILARRAEARAAKEWKLSDTLRDEILALGWIVKDTKEGQKLSPAAPAPMNH